MYHIFTIHSPLTFLVAYSVIEHLQLDPDRVILLSSKYRVPTDRFKVARGYQENQQKWYKKILLRNFPKHYDRYIATLTNGNEFIAYIDLMSYYQKIIVTSKLCRGFHFIEEGNSAYMAVDDLDDLTWEDFRQGMEFRSHGFDSSIFRSLKRVIRGYNLRLISIPYHYMAFVNFKDVRFFCFSENAFYNAPVAKKTVVRPKENSPDINKLALDIVLNHEVIWIDGSNNRYTGLSEQYYYKAIDKAIDILMQNRILQDKIYVKLRPGINDPNENYLVKALNSKQIEVNVLPNELVLEALFIVSNACTVVGTLTAALEYAHVFGHNAYSIYGLFEKQPPTFLDRMTGFWKNVKKL